MRDLEIYAQKCTKMLDQIGISYGDVAQFKVNTRAKRRWGLCRMKNGKFIIEINECLLYEENSQAGLEETILHELLHTCEGCFNHGAEWKRMAERVNRVYGYRIARINSEEEKGVSVLPEYQMRREENKYFFQCEGCGHTIAYKRKTKFCVHPERYVCGFCRGKFKRIDAATYEYWHREGLAVKA